MEENGQSPAKGPIVVTGATGGVGSIAIDMLGARGYEVIAVSGKNQAVGYLESLGAARVLMRQGIDYGSRPLERAQFAGAVDNVGGDMLAWLTRTVGYGGNIASIGLAGSPKLETTVMPFILRAVNLLGINSSGPSRELRLALWKRIASDLAPRHLNEIVTREIELDALPTAFAPYIEGAVIGRTVVRIG
jgi:NADPH2:quinone reductase